MAKECGNSLCNSGQKKKFMEESGTQDQCKLRRTGQREGKPLSESEGTDKGSSIPQQKDTLTWRLKSL